jgi:hypothetical protein
MPPYQKKPNNKECRICKQPLIGLPSKCLTCSPECLKKWRKVYRAEYFQRPGVKERYRENPKKRKERLEKHREASKKWRINHCLNKKGLTNNII